MLHKLKNFTSTVLVLAILLLPNVPALWAVSINQSGVDYIKLATQNAWTTMSLAAVGENITSTSHLENIDASSAINLTAPIMSLAAAGKNPRNVAGRNYVSELKLFHSSGQIGDTNLINDDIFGILALASAGESESSQIIQDAKNTIIAAQDASGSWGDTNTTAAAIMALLETGVAKSDNTIQNAVNFLASAQNNDGGIPFYYPENPFTGEADESDSSSDAWVISAIYKLGGNPESSTWTKNGFTPVDNLLSLQQPSGYFAQSERFPDETSFSSVSTSYAVIALAGQSYPVAKLSNYNSGVTVDLRIEGSSTSVCETTIQATDALEVVEKAANRCGYKYEIQQTSFGPYLSKINGDEAQGLTGWLYFVNNESPPVGAADYKLGEDDDVLWYYGDFDWQITRLTKISENDADINLLVEYLAQGEWLPLEGATLYSNNSPTGQTSGADGTVTLNEIAGFYDLFADKDGFIRTNSITVQIGTPPQGSVNMSVNVLEGEFDIGAGPGGTPGSNAISFLVTPSNLDFGDIAPGNSSTQALKIENNGSVDIHLETVVSGDQVFKENLSLNGQEWPQFQDDITISTSREVSAKLSIPSSFSSVGSQAGTLIFWAQAI